MRLECFLFNHFLSFLKNRRRMKFIKFLMMLVVGFIACSEPQRPVIIEQPQMVAAQPEYTTHVNPHTNQQMVVFKDNSGVEQMMEYMLFMQLMNSMGDGGGCWNCVYGRRDYYRPRNEINVYRQYNIVSDRSNRYNQNNRTNNVVTNSKGAAATSGYGNGIQNTTLKQQNNVGQTNITPPNVGQNVGQAGIQNTTLKRQSPTGMPPSIVKPTVVNKPPTATVKSTPIKQVTLTKKK
jgi:hypothetical protein